MRRRIIKLSDRGAKRGLKAEVNLKPPPEAKLRPTHDMGASTGAGQQPYATVKEGGIRVRGSHESFRLVGFLFFK